MTRLAWTYLGRVPYAEATCLQGVCARKVARGAEPVLLLLEHPPVVTLGRHADPSHLRMTPEEFRRLGIQLAHTDRGGDVTFHGPGQLVGYPIASLRQAGCSVPDWVRGHAEAVVAFLDEYGVRGAWSDTHPGVWVGSSKIAAFGFHISRKVSTHGFALNIDPDLGSFTTIVPCGLEHRGVTSMRRLCRVVPSLPEAAARLAARVAARFGWALGDRIRVGEIRKEANHAAYAEQRAWP